VKLAGPLSFILFGKPTYNRRQLANDLISVERDYNQNRVRRDENHEYSDTQLETAGESQDLSVAPEG
jgi:hypothetical protein